MKPRDIRSMKSVESAVSRYVRSVRQGSVPCRADGDAEGQAANFRDATERAELRYAQIKEVLCDSGVVVCQFVVYRSFGLHVDKLCRDYAGESLRLMVNDAIERWSSYGCKADVLAEICLKVFALDISREL